MRQLSDSDIAEMIGMDFAPDNDATRRDVRSELHLSTRIPPQQKTQMHVNLDLHMHTIEQSWNEIMQLATSDTKTATIITGASGILKIKFQQWVRESILSPYIISCTPINNGSFFVRFRNNKS